MWQNFNTKMAALTNWKATLIQWEEKVLQLTYILIDELYPKNVPQESKKKKGNAPDETEEKEEEQKQEKPRLSSSSSSGVASTRRFVSFPDDQLSQSFLSFYVILWCHLQTCRQTPYGNALE